MENSIYTGLSRQMALANKMDIIANNVANMSTPGYRSQNLLFKEYINQPKASSGKEDPKDPLSMVEDYGQFEDTTEGPMQQTGNPLDVAIHGKGWFGVQTAGGLKYTRAGHFTMDSSGNLITSSGDKVANASGGTITIPNNARDVKISDSGTITTDKGSVGQLMVMGFDNDQDLKPDGQGNYTTTDTGAPSTTARVVQGMIEGSNVQPIREMTQMIGVSRAYEATQQMMVDEHNRLRGMIERLTGNS